MSGPVKDLYNEDELAALTQELSLANRERCKCICRLEKLEASTDESFELQVRQGDYDGGGCPLYVSRSTYIDGVGRALFGIGHDIAAKTREIDAFMAEIRSRLTAPLLANEDMPPDDILAAARNVSAWFADRNIHSWAIDGCQNRS